MCTADTPTFHLVGRGAHRVTQSRHCVRRSARPISVFMATQLNDVPASPRARAREAKLHFLMSQSAHADVNIDREPLAADVNTDRAPLAADNDADVGNNNERRTSAESNNERRTSAESNNERRTSAESDHINDERGRQALPADGVSTLTMSICDTYCRCSGSGLIGAARRSKCREARPSTHSHRLAAHMASA